jgi:hypothetical protein
MNGIRGDFLVGEGDTRTRLVNQTDAAVSVCNRSTSVVGPILAVFIAVFFLSVLCISLPCGNTLVTLRGLYISSFGIRL